MNRTAWTRSSASTDRPGRIASSNRSGKPSTSGPRVREVDPGCGRRQSPPRCWALPRRRWWSWCSSGATRRRRRRRSPRTLVPAGPTTTARSEPSSSTPVSSPAGPSTAIPSRTEEVPTTIEHNGKTLELRSRTPLTKVVVDDSDPGLLWVSAGQTTGDNQAEDGTGCVPLVRYTVTQQGADQVEIVAGQYVAETEPTGPGLCGCPLSRVYRQDPAGLAARRSAGGGRNIQGDRRCARSSAVSCADLSAGRICHRRCQPRSGIGDPHLRQWLQEPRSPGPTRRSS